MKRRTFIQLLLASVSHQALAQVPNANLFWPPTAFFYGGPITALGAITNAGSLYADGVYNDVPLVGGSSTGATANFTVSGGIVTLCTLASGGAVVSQYGAAGYQLTDTNLSVAAANLGGTGSGFVIPVATIGAYSFVVPNGPFGGRSFTYLATAQGAGGPGAGGGTTSGGGGGGGGQAALAQELSVTAGQILTLQVGLAQLGGLAGAPGLTSVATTIVGANESYTGASPGAFGVAGSGTTGGSGGVGAAGNPGGVGGAGAGAAVTASTINNNIVAQGGGGGAGGGSTGAGSTGGNSRINAPGSAGAGNASGGGGGSSAFGRGGNGGGGTTPSAGLAPVDGFGGGGGGGGPGMPGGNSTGGFIRLRAVA